MILVRGLVLNSGIGAGIVLSSPRMNLYSSLPVKLFMLNIVDNISIRDWILSSDSDVNIQVITVYSIRIHRQHLIVRVCYAINQEMICSIQRDKICEDMLVPEISRSSYQL